MAGPEEVLRTLGDPTRLRVLTAVLAGRKNVSQIVEELGLSQPQVSYHLRMLREAGLATEEREGRWVWYEANRAGDERVRQLLDVLDGWGSGRARRRPRARTGAARTPEAVERAEAPEPVERVKPVERPARATTDLDDYLL
jgi:DNA-binding transcriptional ArsR family regulator